MQTHVHTIVRTHLKFSYWLLCSSSIDLAESTVSLSIFLYIYYSVNLPCSFFPQFLWGRLRVRSSSSIFRRSIYRFTHPLKKYVHTLAHFINKLFSFLFFWSLLFDRCIFQTSSGVWRIWKSLRSFELISLLLFFFSMFFFYFFVS